MPSLRRIFARLRKKRFEADPKRDVFLASYPRSGNTWLRAVLYAVESGQVPANLSALDYRIPDEHYFAELARIEPAKRYIVKTHRLYQPRYENYIYIIRDPVDSIESFHRFINKMHNKSTPADKFVQELALGQVWPSSWAKHALSWTANQAGSYIRYEDLVEGKPEAVERLAARLDLPPESDLQHWLSYFDIDRMKKLERAGNRQREDEKGRDWFISGGASVDNKKSIREALHRYEPETAEVAARFGYQI